MGPLGMGRRVPVQDFDQGRGASRHGFCTAERHLVRFNIDVGTTPARGAEKGAQQVARGLRIDEHGFREGGVEHFLDARQQFHPCQAVKAEVAVEGAVERDRIRAALAGAKLGGQITHHLEKPGGAVRRVLAGGRQGVALAGFLGHGK